jgi:hypothetical protein
LGTGRRSKRTKHVCLLLVHLELLPASYDHLDRLLVETLNCGVHFVSLFFLLAGYSLESTAQERGGVAESGKWKEIASPTEESRLSGDMRSTGGFLSTKTRQSRTTTVSYILFAPSPVERNGAVKAYVRTPKAIDLFTSSSHGCLTDSGTHLRELLAFLRVIQSHLHITFPPTSLLHYTQNRSITICWGFYVYFSRIRSGGRMEIRDQDWR